MFFLLKTCECVFSSITTPFASPVKFIFMNEYIPSAKKSKTTSTFFCKVQETSSSVRLVGLQAADAESLNQWLTALRRSRGEVSKTPTTKVPKGKWEGEMNLWRMSCWN